MKTTIPPTRGTDKLYSDKIENNLFVHYLLYPLLVWSFPKSVMPVSSRKKQRQRHRRNFHIRRTRRVNEVEEQLDSDINMLLLFLLAVQLSIDDSKMAFGGNKGEELHFCRKDIFSSLSGRYFRRSYRMHRGSFYRLHSILEPHLN